MSNRAILNVAWFQLSTAKYVLEFIRILSLNNTQLDPEYFQSPGNVS